MLTLACSLLVASTLPLEASVTTRSVFGSFDVNGTFRILAKELSLPRALRYSTL